MAKGVYNLNSKKRTVYRASITIRGKHISLGTHQTEEAAKKAYETACDIKEKHLSISDYTPGSLDFKYWVILINYRDNKVYSSAPIYLYSTCFYYYLNANDYIIFDTDDLFFYSSHKIMKRGRHLFVYEYGSQHNILSRYGIRNYAVEGRDYIFINNNRNDLRYSNIRIINRYYGVERHEETPHVSYRAYIHYKGRKLVGTYEDEISAAIAYNKARDYLKLTTIPMNYIENLSAIEYAKTYNKIRLSASIKQSRTPGGT